MSLFKIVILVIALLIICFVIGLYINNLIVTFSSGYWVDRIDNIDKKPVALVLGAAVYEDGKLSIILKDRVDSSIELYKRDRVSKLLFSGAQHTISYDEVNAMKNYALSRGVSARDIFLDPKGLRTYDSLHRARDIFGLQSFYIITQKFHLDRAIYIARHLGLDAYGIPADKRIYSVHSINIAREFLARVKAYLEIHVFLYLRKYLGPKTDI